MGYQACAAEALMRCLAGSGIVFDGRRLLDVGCAVGVTAGVLGLKGVTGFDLFVGLLDTARRIDAITGVANNYVCADMTNPWPFGTTFGTVVCGLVCHHLKNQAETAGFFHESNRVLETGGMLIVTLPAGAINTPKQLARITAALDSFGFETDIDLTGVVVSDDNELSLFWMLLIVARKRHSPTSGVFISPDFAFQQFKTPVSREEKGARVRRSVQNVRRVKHESFRLIRIGELLERHPDLSLVFGNVRGLTG